MVPCDIWETCHVTLTRRPTFSESSVEFIFKNLSICLDTIKKRIVKLRIHDEINATFIKCVRRFIKDIRSSCKTVEQSSNAFGAGP